LDCVLLIESDIFKTDKALFSGTVTEETKNIEVAITNQSSR
jgi:hypothetical protein